MTVFSFILIILLTLAIAWPAEYAIIKLAYRFKIFDKPNARKIHSQQIPRLGGVVFLPVVLLSMSLMRAFNVAGTLSFGSIMQILPALLTIYFIGIVDDIWGVRYRVKFLFQAMAGCLLCLAGFSFCDLHGLLGIHHLPEIASWFVTIFVIIYMANAVNFIDGIDGLASCLTVIACLFFASVFALRADWPFCLLALTVLVSQLPFMYYNLFGDSECRSKVFMGDAGSLTLGVMFTVFSIRCTQIVPDTVANPLSLAVAPIALPLLDVVYVVFCRLRHGANPFAADKSHVHHRVMAAGWSQRATLAIVVLCSLLLSAVCAGAAFCLDINLTFVLVVALWLCVNHLVSHRINK